MLNWYRRQLNIVKLGIIVLFVIVAVIILANVFPPPPKTNVASNTTNNTVTDVPTQAPTTSIDTNTPTPTVASIQPTPTPQNAKFDPLAPIPGDTVLGQPLSHFVAKYGTPNDHTSAKDGKYDFQRYAGTPTDSIILQTDVVDGGSYAYLVEGIDAQSPRSGWSSDIANVICTGFLPHDAEYKSQFPLTSGMGYDKIYYSASFASVFPASEFTDAKTNQIQPGMFDVQYLVRSDSSIDSCSLQIGTQQAQ